MARQRRWGGRLHRLPRPVYWTLGAAIAFGGAVGAREVAEMVAVPTVRIAIWLTGAVFIFIGLAVLSMGTRARLEDEELFANRAEQRNDDGPKANGP